MNHTHIIRIACAVSLGGLTGCGLSDTMYENTIVATLDDLTGNEYRTAVERRMELEKELTDLEKTRVDAVAQMKERIATSKAAIASSVEALDLGAALDKLKDLDEHLHAPADKEPKANSHRLAAYADLTDRAYIASTSMEIIARAEDAMNAGKFQSLEPVLDPKRLPSHADPGAEAALESKRTEFRQRWLEFLDAASKKELRARPATATMYAVKGAQLAAQLGDEAKKKTLLARAKSARAAVAKKHGYDVVVSGARGTDAASVAKSLMSAKWGVRPITVKNSRSGATDASLSFTLGAPSFKKGKSKTSQTFRYKSGTKQVPNPLWEEDQKDCKDRQESYADRIEACNANPVNSSGNPTIDCQLVSQDKSFMDMSCDKVDRYKPSHTVDVFDEQSYPVNVYSMRVSASSSAELAPVKGAAKRVSKKIATELTDEEHAAHSKNGSGVSADPAKPPSQAQAQRALANLSLGWLRGLVDEGMLAHQRGFLGGSGDRTERLAVHVLLDPSKADAGALEELERELEVDGLKALLGAR